MQGHVHHLSSCIRHSDDAQPPQNSVETAASSCSLDESRLSLILRFEFVLIT
jgi:hypothetical protein